ncbi:WapI family immunity protein [Litoribrevibacter albus]|uniref:Uncharacterized protein n=1 Tax=Litoribrevibacter albus TaxID=1473156 RepID=A0AA37S717_9GAMM|nr:hypothetical protein [Litoribrevibacter albus]GLQ29634.1 hypothetical protein GCM10007876_01120 [Litoribrevibacter albus]
MINLTNIEEKINLYIEVAGYEFPEIEDDDWCLLRLRIQQESDSIELVDPAIETTELAQLLHWFSSLVEGRLPEYAHLDFVEPCISFEFLAFKEDVVRISINLSHELSPSFPMRQFGSEANEWSIVFDLGEEQLKSICSGIKKTLDQYPIRGC